MKKDASIEITREHGLFQRREEAQPHMSYAHEKIRYRVITEGRIEEVERRGSFRTMKRAIRKTC